MEYTEVEYPYEVDKRRLGMSNGIQFKESGEAVYCLQLVLLNVGLKRKLPPSWLIGLIQTEPVPKIIDRGSFYSAPQLTSPATQRDFRGF